MYRKISALLLLTCFAVCPMAQANLEDGSSHMISYGRGESLLVLGSEDDREGYYFSYAYGRNEPKFRLRSLHAQFVLEGYYSRTRGGGVSGQPHDATDAFGVIAYAHYQKPLSGKVGVYLDLGLGLQMADESTVDLDSRLNSTPILGGGFAFKSGGQEILLGLRLLHISNAGTIGDNQGQNQLYFTAGLRF